MEQSYTTIIQSYTYRKLRHTNYNTTKVHVNSIQLLVIKEVVDKILRVHNMYEVVRCLMERFNNCKKKTNMIQLVHVHVYTTYIY